MPPTTPRKKRSQARQGAVVRPPAPAKGAGCAQDGFITTRMDNKGRITLPAELRGALQEGTTFAIRAEGSGFVLAPIENPFDALAAEAIEEQRAGRTRNLRDFARERNIALDDP